MYAFKFFRPASQHIEFLQSYRRVLGELKRIIVDRLNGNVEMIK